MPESSTMSMTPRPTVQIAIRIIGPILYTALLVPVGTVLMLFLIMPPWGEDGHRAWLEHTCEALADPEWWAWGGLVCGVIVVTQFLFLVPVVRLRPPRGERARPLVVSLMLGAVIAAGLTGAIGLGLAELIASSRMADWSADPWQGRELAGRPWMWPGLAAVLLGSWGLWTLLLLVFTRELWADRLLGRLVVLLFGGTVVELLVVIPIDIMVRRRTACYCATGTFLALCGSAVALVWLAGPGIVLALTSRRRRLVRETHCARCGHPKGPTPGPACPECGHAWGGRAAAILGARVSDGDRSSVG
jgi:uncharacterized membrane protein YdcZ (DUF606 family)